MLHLLWLLSLRQIVILYNVLSSSYPKFDLLPFFIIICRSRFSYFSAFEIYPKIYLHSLYILSTIKSLTGFPNELYAHFPLFICTISDVPPTFILPFIYFPRIILNIPETIYLGHIYADQQFSGLLAIRYKRFTESSRRPTEGPLMSRPF